MNCASWIAHAVRDWPSYGRAIVAQRLCIREALRALLTGGSTCRPFALFAAECGPNRW